MSNSVHIVLAHHHEDVRYVNNFKYRYTIISRQGIPSGVPPNIGNEGSVYLQYIINNYNNLSDYTFFIHAHRNHWHHKSNIDDKINSIKLVHNYYNINETQSDKLYSVYQSGDALGHDYIECIEEFMNYMDFKFDYKNMYCRVSAQFYVKRENIHRHPIDFYIKMYNWIMTTKYSVRCGYVLEHIWHIIFTGNIIDTL
jgi:hypothetical protein